MTYTRSVPGAVALAVTLVLACGGSDTAPPVAATPEAGVPVTDDAGSSTPDTGPIDSGPVHTGPLPLITEFLASNGTGLLDEDGQASDWIEIHNPDTVPYDLSGHHLTDTKTKPLRWAFPDGTVLQPGGYMVVFASNKNRAVAGKPLHTNFGLTSGDACTRLGGYLALTDKSGAVLPPAWDPYPAQTADISHGLLTPSPTASQAFFAKPTPGAPNDAASVLAERVAFTPASGTFASGTTRSVALKVTSPTATVRYTTNRARPIAVAGKAGTFTADATTDVCTLTAHGLADGDLVRVSGPAPLVSTVNYFVRVLGPDTFKLTVKRTDPAIDLTASGSFEIRREAATGTAAVATDLITTTFAHTFYSGDAVQVSTAGTLPAGITAGTTYYVVVASPTTFRLSTSPTLAPVVDITTTGTGTQTVVRIPSPVYAAPIPVTVNTRIRARAFEPGRPDGPIGSEMYFALDAAAQARTSTLPLVVSHTFNTVMTDTNTTVYGHLMMFEPKPPDNVARLTNPPDFTSASTLQRHGSSTGNDPKFSTAVQLVDEDAVNQSCSVFGMPADSHWLMHAPYQFDRSMMHNDLLYRLSNDVGRWAVHTKYVEHLHNETTTPDTIEGGPVATDYFGVYSFMERITVGKSRVNIDKLTIQDNTLPNVQGGYVFKADRLGPGEIGIKPLAGQSFGGAGPSGTLAWDDPREISTDPFNIVTTAQSDWLRGYLGTSYATLAGAGATDPVNGYAKYWDVGSVIDHHILNLCTKNADAFALSSYWHKPRLGKLTAGPVWDFDRAEGSTDGRDFDWGTWPGSGGRDYFSYPWYKEMFTDPNFWQAWIDRFDELRRGPLATATVVAHIDEFAAILNPGNAADTPAKRSAGRWAPSLPRTAASNTAITNNLFDGTYTGEVAWLKYWWSGRLAFIDGQFTRPAVSSLAQGKVPAGSTVTLSSPSQSSPGVKIYYTTDGTDPRPSAPGPVLSPSAVEYTAPITITGPTKLFVRTWNPATPTPPGAGTTLVGSRWSAPTVLSYTL